MPTKYAKNTKVSIYQSQIDIQNLFRKYGAKKYAIDWENNNILFELHGHSGRIHVKSPNINDPEIQRTPSGLLRTENAIKVEYEKRERQKWRVMLLFLKASFEAVENDVLTIDQALFSYLLLPNQKTIAEQLLPNLSKTNILQLPDHKF